MGIGTEARKVGDTLVVRTKGEGVRRRVVLRVGTVYRIEPPNTAKLHNRGRCCTLLTLDADHRRVDELGRSTANRPCKVAVRFVDTGRRGRVPPEDLVDLK